MEDDDKENLGKAIGCVALLLAIVPCYLLEGYVFSLTWNWFIVPLGVRPIGVAWAIGIFALGEFVTHQHPGKTDRSVRSILGWAVTWPIVLLVVGYIAHRCMV